MLATNMTPEAVDRKSTDAPTNLCSECGKESRTVKGLTLERLIRPERRGDIGSDQYYVCATPTCDTVYFGATARKTFSKCDLTVRFGLKESASPRPICYCFDHAIEDIYDEIRSSGSCTMVDRIKADLKNLGCRCEQLNPLGTCCVKSIQAEVANALHQPPNVSQVATPAKIDHASCCGDLREPHQEVLGSSTSFQKQGDHTGDGPARERAGTLAAGSSVVAAILSSACCWLPLVLVAFGASAAGVAGFFEAYRLYFVVGAVGLLGLGFYLIYFRKAQCEAGSACATPSRRLNKFNQLMLWTATALVGAFVMFPNYVGLVLGAPHHASPEIDAVGLASVKYQIEGMTCEACAATLHSALIKLREVKTADVDFATNTAVIRYEPSNPVTTDHVVEVAAAAGFTANPFGREQ